MARFAKGSRALAISDRSGAAFPYREMVKEWTGAWVHISEFEPKQPQLEPHPVGADPQGLLHARPARVEFPVQDILPNNPFTTTAGSQTLSVSYPSNQINEGTSYVRFQSVKEIVGGVAIATLELETTLNGAINDTVNTLTLTDSSAFPNAGFIVIEKVDQNPTISVGGATQNNPTFGQYINEVIQYTGNNTGTGVLSGLTRGTAAPFRGITFSNTTATTHANGAKVFGSYLATAVATTVEVGPTLPNGTQATETQYNSITVPLVSNAGSTATGGGFQCTIGPVNDRG
ncbi:MAG: hypothetical protein CBD88_08670 [Flavobacteriales bacterium TMED228]|nr:MAG: hypothetical protein CBD88_08670 [Flavobacteriales bacterium TMED228]